MMQHYKYKKNTMRAVTLNEILSNYGPSNLYLRTAFKSSFLSDRNLQLHHTF